jgi:hypothetical protein
MKVNTMRRMIVALMTLAMLVFVVGADASPPRRSQHHKSGHALLGDGLKTNGTHQLEKKGKFTASAEVRGGKVAGVHVKHDTRGDIAVKKYKSRKKIASADEPPSGSVPAQTDPAQTDLGTLWIAYAYIDDDGDEEYYWFPYEEILDGDTGAVDYVPLN